MPGEGAMPEKIEAARDRGVGEALDASRTSRLRWYWDRLRSMSPGEMVYRTRQFFRGQIERAELAGAYSPPVPDFSRSTRPPLWTVPATADPASYDNVARTIAGGRLRVLSLDAVQLGATPRWNRDYLTGIEAPLVFGATLDYRNANLVGDIKHLWEPNRHLHLVTLAQAYALTKDEMHLETLRRHLTSWLDQCPYPLGPNWLSSLELAIRLINWAFVWELIGGPGSALFGGEGGIALRSGWLRSIYQHVNFILIHLSRYSSANNHLIGELAGAFVASRVWPYWTSLTECGDAAYGELYREALTQTTGDGVDREQSTCYHRYVAEFMLLAGLVARATGEDFPPAYWARLEAMLDFIASVMDVGGNVPMIGDADDGQVVRLDPHPTACPFRSLLAVGAALFSRPEFWAKAGSIDDSVSWLLSSKAPALFDQPRRAGQGIRRSFEEGGYFILGSELDCQSEIRIIADVGPLGYRSLAAHGHADALSFSLSVGGKPFLVDPGTYAYHMKQQWRNYFRGTASHNTARVDGEDQSVIAGNFLWGFKAVARRESWESGDDVDRLVGSHHGYLRLRDPVLHRREICLRKSVSDPVTLLIVDTFECRQSHAVELFFHFDETCQVRPFAQQRVMAFREDLLVEIEWRQTPGTLALYRGNEELPLGWISRALERKTATTTAVWSLQICGTTSVETTLRCYRNRKQNSGWFSELESEKISGLRY